MSRASKITFALSCVLTATTVIGVHIVQGMERETLHQGPIKDARRIAAKQELKQQEENSKSRKRIFNQTEHEQQLELRKKYESMQPLSGKIHAEDSDDRGHDNPQ